MTPATHGPRWTSLLLLGGLGLLLSGGPARGDAREDSLRFAIRFEADVYTDTLDGRLVLLLSTDDSDDSDEPRFQIKDGPETQLAFGIDVEGLAPGQTARIGAGVLGWPVDSLADLPAGEYTVQALLHRYETFHRADGHTLKLPMDRGEGQQWNKAPGNLYSQPRKVTIDHEVAERWRENYDLAHILRRDWATLGPKLEGKIHIYVGDMDNYYLNNAVYLTEEFLKSTKDPHYGGEVDYGDRAEHCWNGDQSRPNATSRLRYNQMFVPRILERIEKTAPAGADLESWRY